MTIHLLSFVLLAGSCGGAAKVRPAAAPTPLPAPAPAAAVVPVPAPAIDPGPPAGYVPMHVVRVASLPEGNAVLLANAGETVVLPIFVGETEALSIHLRLAGQTYERPLTHDLLDSVLRELGGRVVRVDIDSIRDRVFIGTLHLRHGERSFGVDARPSDAIAMALGSGAPIFASPAVVGTAGVGVPDAPPPPRTF